MIIANEPIGGHLRALFLRLGGFHADEFPGLHRQCGVLQDSKSCLKWPLLQTPCRVEKRRQGPLEDIYCTR